MLGLKRESEEVRKETGEKHSFDNKILDLHVETKEKPIAQTIHLITKNSQIGIDKREIKSKPNLMEQ